MALKTPLTKAILNPIKTKLTPPIKYDIVDTFISSLLLLLSRSYRQHLSNCNPSIWVCLLLDIRISLETLHELEHESIGLLLDEKISIPLAILSSRGPDWHSLAKEYGFHVIRERSSQASVEASPEAIESLQKAHPEIKVTSQKNYHSLKYHALSI